MKESRNKSIQHPKRIEQNQHVYQDRHRPSFTLESQSLTCKFLSLLFVKTKVSRLGMASADNSLPSNRHSPFNQALTVCCNGALGMLTAGWGLLDEMGL